MKRPLVAVALLSMVLIATIAWRIRSQTKAQEGPASGSGLAEAEGINIGARLSARVMRVVAVEGSAVEAGAPILELECDEPRARLAEAKARLAVARAQADAAEAQVLVAKGQSAAAQASVGSAQSTALALDAQKELAARDAQRIESMGQHAAQSALDRARVAAVELAENQHAAEAARRASLKQAGAAQAQAKAALAQAQGFIENVRALEAMVEAASVQVRECLIVAPRPGVLERVYYEAGELVSPGQIVARLIDPGVVNVVFYMSNNEVDRARVGMPARVLADAYPDRTFEARVSRVGLEAEFTPRSVQTRTDRDRLVFPVEVTVAQRERALRSGMPVQVILAEGAL